ncbi:MAG TPA: DUF2827 family protein [Azonexus sp.]|nr:DUF2827 family protein [Azonexus sp.]
MRIGISTLSTAEQNIWSAGITQNALFLAKLLRSIPFVRDVVLLDAGSEDCLGPQVDLDWFGTRMLKLRDATDCVDVIIEMVGAIDTAWLQLQQARGKKTVWYCVGHPYSGLVEPSIFKDSGFFLLTDRHDAIWLLPEYAAFTQMLRTLHRSPVFETPYLWDPVFLKLRIDELAKSGLQFGYAPRVDSPNGTATPGWNLAIFEPNLSPTKSGLISMLVADAACRKVPESIRQLNVLNTQHLVEHPTLLYFANALDLVRNHRAIFTGRHDTAGFMINNQIDAVLSHQWTNDQNYLYLDVLYGNYPLIHNSPWLKDAGYYYPDFEVQVGATELLRAKLNHYRDLNGYAKRTSRVLEHVSISHQPNVLAFADLLRALCHDRPQWLEA